MSIFSRRNSSENEPKKSEFQNRSRNDNNRNSRDRRMYTVTCDDCGKTCEVPFKPTGDKPVYCSECFEKRGNGRDNNNRSNRNSRRDYGRSGGRRDGGRSRSNGNKEMFPAICDACGKECMVPFRPSNDKPIYCSECFEERGNGRDDNRRDRRDNRSSNRNSYRENRTGSDNREQLQDISNKLEKIIELLDTRKVVRVKATKDSSLKEESKKQEDNDQTPSKDINPDSLLED